MGNNFSSVSSLQRGNPSRASRGHPQNLKGKLRRPGRSGREGYGAGGVVGRGAVGDDRQVPPVVCIWTAGEALLTVEVGCGSS